MSIENITYEPSEALVNLFLTIQENITTYISKHDVKNSTDLMARLQTEIRTFLKSPQAKGIINTPSKSELKKIYDYLRSKNRVQPNFIMESLLTTKSIRSNSGILPISVALDGRFFSCAYNCSYCPNEPNMARSYLSSEGTFIRGAIQNFNTVEQIWRRLAELEIMGHPPDKLEIIALGGTFDCFPKEYRRQFALDVFYACNMYAHMSIKFNGKYQHILRKWIQKNPFLNNLPLDPELHLKLRSSRVPGSLVHEQNLNTKSPCCRVVGMVLETRPDHINRFTMTEMRELGCTRVQIGIQSTSDAVLSFNSRGHTVEASIKANRMLRDNGFKVDGHLMPDLPGSCLELDYEMMRDVFQGYDLQLDYAKIYPCLDLPFTQIRKWKETREWQPVAETRFPEFIAFLGYALSIVPPWTRINRVQRDFPEATLKNNHLGYVSDTIKTNLQQFVMKYMESNGLKCYDIRSREIRNNIIDNKLTDAVLFIRSYTANGGTEFFISVEIPNEGRQSFDDCSLLGLCRLRIPESTEADRVPHHYLPVYRQRGMRIGRIRELHVYGNVTTTISTATTNTQHRGVGKFLMCVAENIAKAHNCDMVTVISGVGVRDYYEHLGYTLDTRVDQYMTKYLTKYTDSMNLFNKTYVWEQIWSAMKSKQSVHYYNDIQNGEAYGISFKVHTDTDNNDFQNFWIYMSLLVTTFIVNIFILMLIN
jgi:ELP3 family radical SAM enzyme/protein acetyltransferase